MPARFCRICGSPASETSIFCDAHRAQAALFSKSLVPEAPPPEAEASEAAAPPSARRDAEGAQATIDELAIAVRGCVNRVLAAPPTPGVPSYRQPLFAFYHLHGELHARAYWAVAPTPFSTGSFGPEPEATQRDLLPGGPVFAELQRLYLERRAALESGALQAIELEVRAAAGELLLFARKDDVTRTALATFRREGSSLVLSVPQ